MNRKQHQKPFYRRPWLWIVVALLLVGGGQFISNHNQAQKTHEDSVAKATKELDKKKKSTKESKDKGKDSSTMYCYLPGQYPDPGIAPENVVYFDSLADAQAAGYRTHQ